MDRTRTLAVVSAALLGSGVAGWRVGCASLALTMVAGYLGERLVRQRLRPAGWDTLESPLIIAALGFSVGMAALGNVCPASGTNPKRPQVAGS